MENLVIGIFGVLTLGAVVYGFYIIVANKKEEKTEAL